MANTKSALKRIRQAEKRRQRNKQIKTRIKSTVRDYLNSLGEEDKESAHQKLISAIKTIDKATSKGIIHKRTAARKKSRLAKKLNKVQQVG
ncbi:MAG TPA: 30S ribosomal protein S20 [Firmicutes bacterium]|jgi:small subunit ribosomal protein S20|nr:30S ribosomal protein S20 [Bacillota bacterium]